MSSNFEYSPSNHQQGGTLAQDSHNSKPGNQKTSLWMGELEPWYDETLIQNMWLSVGENVSTVKLIRDKFNGTNAGYCFVEFGSQQAAERALNTYNGQPIPAIAGLSGLGKVFRLNWASGGGINDKRDDRSPEFSIFVGDLSPEISEQTLLQLFQSRYPSCKSARIMTDTVTNVSRGYGFVRFSDDVEMHLALMEMQGYFLGSRPIRISTATPKTKYHFHPQLQGQVPNGAHNGVYYAPTQPLNQFTDPHNTTVFIGGLSAQVSEDELRHYFQGFGDIIYVKIPQGKGCGFVQYVHRQSAEAAITQMQGYPIGTSRVRLSWGRSQQQQQQQYQQHQIHQYQPSGGMYRMSPANGYPQLGGDNSFQYGIYGQPMPTNDPTQAHGVQSALNDPSEPVPVARLNELYLAARDGRLDRLEIDSRGYHGVYAQ